MRDGILNLGLAPQALTCRRFAAKTDSAKRDVVAEWHGLLRVTGGGAALTTG